MILHDRQAEVEVLAGLLATPKLLLDVRYLTPSHFEEPTHAAIFEGMLAELGHAFDEVSLKATLTSTNRFAIAFSTFGRQFATRSPDTAPTV